MEVTLAEGFVRLVDEGVVVGGELETFHVAFESHLDDLLLVRLHFVG